MRGSALSLHAGGDAAGAALVPRRTPRPALALVILAALVGGASLSSPATGQTPSPGPAPAAPNTRSPAPGALLTGNPPVRVYLDRHGLPQNTAESLALDAHGYLWVGTQAGAARYDGIEWRSFRPPSPSGSHFIHVLLAARDGSMWFGSDGGDLTRLEDEVVTSFEALGSQQAKRIRSLAEVDGPGGQTAILVGTDRGLSVVEGSGLRDMPVPPLGPLVENVQALLQARSPDGRQVLWVGAATGLARRIGTEWSGVLSGQAGLPEGGVTALAEVSPADGPPVLWVGTLHGVVRALGENGPFEPLPPRCDFLPPVRVNALMSTKKPGG